MGAAPGSVGGREVTSGRALEQELVGELGESDRLRLFARYLDGWQGVDEGAFAALNEGHRKSTRSSMLRERRRSVSAGPARKKLEAFASRVESLAAWCDSTERLDSLLGPILRPTSFRSFVDELRRAAVDARAKAQTLPVPTRGHPPSTSDPADIVRHIAAVWSACGVGKISASNNGTRFMRAIGVCCRHYELPEIHPAVARAALKSPLRGGVPTPRVSSPR